jgi:hypothetical protein
VATLCTSKQATRATQRVPDVFLPATELLHNGARYPVIWEPTRPNILLLLLFFIRGNIRARIPKIPRQKNITVESIIAEEKNFSGNHSTENKTKAASNARL